MAGRTSKDSEVLTQLTQESAVFYDKLRELEGRKSALKERKARRQEEVR